MRASSALLAVACVLLLSSLVAAQRSYISPEDAEAPGMNILQTYVSTPDSNFAWTRISEYDEQGLGYKVMWLNMTSQQWLNSSDVSQPIWWHFVAVIVPQNMNASFTGKALLYITGGNNEGKPPKLTSEDLLVAAILAQTSQTLTVVLFQIPNQPITFYNSGESPHGQKEDGLISTAWRLFLEDPTRTEFIPYLPMTKAGVRVMDAVSEFWMEEAQVELSEWVVSGASKRGWTTWLVAACDPTRVVAFIPMVFDELNFVRNIHHHWRAYGGWSFALADYVHNNITTSFDTPEFAYMMSIIDPFVYLPILTQPKLLISTGGDEFLLPDNHDYYQAFLQGESHFHSFPNTEHSMITNIPLVLETIAGFVGAIQTATARPEYSWQKLSDGTLVVEVSASNPPQSVTVWSARTIDQALRRDFRLVTLNTTSGKPGLHPVVWYQGSQLVPTSSNSTMITYTALIEPPPVGQGWVGFVIELIWPGALAGTNFRVSTAVSILPQTFPFPDCYLETCQGPLV